MKKLIRIACVLALALGGTAIVGCHSGAGNDPGVDENGRRHAIPYYCPMHPEVTSTGPDKCRICGMQLVPKER